MSEKIKNNKGGEGAWNIPNNGKVWEADWTGDVDVKEKNDLEFEFFSKEKDFDSSKLDDSAEAENRIVDFRKRVAKKAGRLALYARFESLEKAA